MKLLFPILSVLIFLTGCRSDNHEYPNKMIFRYNEAANITSLDPAFARDQANIWAMHQIFNGLLQLNDRLDVIPCIARTWTISPDGLEYTFILRNDVYFHDSPLFPGGKGRRVKASDLSYSFSRIADPKTASSGGWIFKDVELKEGLYAFDAINDTLFRIHLNHAYPPFLGLLTTIYCSVVPREAVLFYGPDFRKNPIGTGPFRFKIWKEGVKMVLVKNPHYFESYRGYRLPFLDAVAISFLADKQSAFLEFLKGKLDFMSGIDPNYIDEILTRQGHLKPKFTSRFNLITQPYLNTEYLGFLLDEKSEIVNNNPLKIKKLRQAINYSFDRRKMIQYLRNNIGTPGVNGFLPKGIPSFDSLKIYYEYDPDKARRLLAEAGFPDGVGLSPVTLTTTSDYLDICKYIQHQAVETGIGMKIEILPPAVLKEMKAQAKLPFFRASWIADYPDAESYFSLFYSKNFSPTGPNSTHFSNPEFDALYNKAMQAVNDTLRYAYYQRMEQLVMDEAPVVVLYYDQVLRFVQKNVYGLGSDPMNMLTLKYVIKKF